jgi:hypothetical protein
VLHQIHVVVLSPDDKRRTLFFNFIKMNIKTYVIMLGSGRISSKTSVQISISPLY